MGIEIIVGTVFLIGYLAITLEHPLKIHKSITAVALGAILWALIAILGHEAGHGVTESLHEIGGEVFDLIIFLMAAMTLVEFLVHYRLFDVIRAKLFSLGLRDKGQLWIIGTIAFFLSAIIDNLTTTIVMIQIARRFFKGHNLVLAAGTIVIAANAGGAFSPIGDVTTIMLWLADKFTAGEIITQAFLPSLALFGVSTALLARSIQGESEDIQEERIALRRTEVVVIAAAFGSFFLPLAMSQIGLPPYLGLLGGLGIVGILVSIFRTTHKHPTHLEAQIDGFLQKIDLASLLFFAGILLAVGALRHLGILADISAALFGANPELWRLILGNSVLGVLSAIVDNIPLTAAAMTIVSSTDPAIWVLLALAVGTGGSLLVIGSAAGVVAMGMVKELTFGKYLRHVTFPALVGYIVAIVIWYTQYTLLG